MLENCTYSTDWPQFDGKKRGKTVRYRASFELVPRKGDHMTVYRGKAFSYHDLYARSVVVKSFNYCGNAEDCKMYALLSKHGQIVAERFNKFFDNLFKIRFPVPAVTAMNQRAPITCRKKLGRDEAVVFEEELPGEFITFIDKRAKTLERCTSSQILQAFCHFSHCVSGGTFVICGLKGVQKKGFLEFTLTNPTIHSRDGKFGPKDKRDAGIQDFKDNHVCNKLCRMFLKKTTFEFEKVSDEC